MKKEMINKLPEIKKTINAFLVGEEGKISKHSIIKAGVVLAAVSLSALNIASAETTHDETLHTDLYPHSNSLDSDYSGGTASGTHDHHASHDEVAYYEEYTEVPEPDTTPCGGACGTGTTCNTATNVCETTPSCCFPAGTMVSTKDGKISIEKIKVGDKIIAYDLKKKKTVEAKVLKLESPIREGIYNINKDLIKVTSEHPFYIKKKNGKVGWGAIEKIAAMKDCISLKDIMTLETGDFIFEIKKGWIKIKSIEYKPGHIKTYNLKHVKGYNNFFAEGLLVHNKYY